jgi:hypothetical protein
MARFREPPHDFVCPYRDHCPELQGLSTTWVFGEHHRARIREHEHWRIRDEMAAEIGGLEKALREQSAEIDRLRAENKRLHQSRFKPHNKNSKARQATSKGIDRDKSKARTGAKKRGAPTGHPPWTRKTPQRIDRTVHVDAPCTCPHCHGATDLSRSDATSYIQEDIVLRPQTVVTNYIHQTAYCSGCRRQVFEKLEGELAFAPIGPEAKAAALYLRHSNIVHADETYWREDGRNVIVWYAGNENVAVFRIDPHRSAEAAKKLLGERIEGLLVTDAYASYNSIEVQGRQSCLAHLLRTAREIGQILAAMKNPDVASARFCIRLTRLLKMACALNIPAGLKAREKLTERLLGILQRVCERPLEYHKAETLRKRLIPGAREHSEVFAFIRFDGPATNNHAERALRPLVIFRKVCMGTRSEEGSRNIGIFTSLTQTANLQKSSVLDLFRNLLTGTAAKAQDVLFTNSS